MNKQIPIIELAGMPRAGKTTMSSMLNYYFTINSRKSRIIPEAAERAPKFLSKHEWTFNAWTLFKTCSWVLEEIPLSEPDILICDRGLYDACCWFNWHWKQGRLSNESYGRLTHFHSISEWPASTKLIVVLDVSFDAALERAKAEGSILNRNTFGELQRAFINERPQQPDGSILVDIDTSELTPNETFSKILETIETLYI